jgi:uncharacterized protein (TIGR02996 family)
MNEREALLRAICDNPDDDTLRLVFADWLQEHGDESDQARAEFIRVQIEADRGTAGGRYRGPYDALSQRLLDQHESEWRVGLTESPGFGWGKFHRGFIDSLFIQRPGTIPFEYWCLACDITPVQDLLISGGIPCEQFLLWSCLGRLRMLELYAPGWSEDEWQSFASCPALRDGLDFWVSVDYPCASTRQRLESRFRVEYFAS